MEVDYQLIKILELFGGIGAPRKALVKLGYPHKSIDYVEFNEKAVRSYNAMFDNSYSPQNVVGYNLKPDILVHGSPCQDFSIAGKQYGGNVSDGTRSSLMFETIRIIENLGAWKPRFVVWENVTNVLSKRMVNAFNYYIEDMNNLGYTNSYSILNAMDFGIPQYRKRIFTISTLGDNSFNFSNLENKRMKPISMFLENDVDNRYIVTAPSMLRNIIGSSTYIPPEKTKFKGRIEVITEYARVITTAQDRNPNSGVVKLGEDIYRVLTEKECWRLMGFDDADFYNALSANPTNDNSLNKVLYHQAGNSMVVDVLEAIFKNIV
jgi:DNA (cytosine-5)-methyltransferase 1